MSDQRQDDEAVGRALGRAIETQTVRSTPYATSRLAHRIDRPAGRGWTYALPMAAALALFIAMGAFFATRGPQGGVAMPNASASPSISATTGPAPSPTPTAATSPVTTGPLRLYFARDGLPPIAADVRATSPAGAVGAERITARLNALIDARQNDVPTGASTAVALTAQQRAQVRPVFTSSISADLATVELLTDTRWPIAGAAMERAFVQQLVYTASEEPGIRRVLLTGTGGKPLTIDQLVIDKALSREDVFGYQPLAAADRRIASDADVVPANLTAKIESVQSTPGQPVRLVIDLAPRQTLPAGSGGSWLPAFVATMRETTGSSAAKYEIEVAVRGGTEMTLRDQVIDVTPLRYVRVSAATDGTTYSLGVDDARPWRVSIMPGPSGGMRLHVDIGGHPAMVNKNIAVYSPVAGQTVTGSITISGAARVFEANVVWRLLDANGREVARGFSTATQGNSPVWGSFQTSAPIPAGLTGRATLEVFWGSPRDGSDQDVVSIPLTVR